MPTYQYLCTACGHAFDQVQSFSDDALTVCPECTGKLRKVFNSVGVVFKGSGFYKTDSRSSTTATSPAASESSKSEPTKSDSGSSSSTPSTPAKSTPSTSGSSTSTASSPA